MITGEVRHPRPRKETRMQLLGASRLELRIRDQVDYVETEMAPSKESTRYMQPGSL